MKKAIPVIGAIAAVAVAVFVVFAVVKTGKLPLTVEETYQIPQGGEVTFVASTNSAGTALKVRVDLSVMTNLVSGLPLEEECWLVFHADPVPETNVLVRVVQ